MLLIFLDTETTGLDPFSHRIVDIAIEIVDSTNGEILKSYESVVQQPTEVIEAADPQSLVINGFDRDLILQGKPEQVVADDIRRLFDEIDLSDNEGVFICQNPSFDRPFFGHLISVKEAQEKNWPYHWLDLASMYWTRYHDSIRQERQISKNAIAKALGLPKEEEPHRAMNGVKHLLACYQKLYQSDGSQAQPAQ